MKRSEWSLFGRDLRECANGIFGSDAASILIIDRHAILVMADAGNYRVQTQSGIVGFQKRGSFALEPGLETTLINGKVILP